jgi:hypothetical protein
MKVCPYCGNEIDGDAASCDACGSDSGDTPAKLEFIVPTPEQMEMDFVTLLRCRTLVDADLIVAQLESAGIAAFIPDEFVMQNVGFSMNTRGNVRIQVSPKDYEEAKDFLSAGAAPSGSSTE